MNMPVFDLHCDTAFEMLGYNGNPEKGLLTNDLHIDLTRASSLPAYTQCFACFSTLPKHSDSLDPTVMFRNEVEKIKREIAANAGKISLVTSVDQIERNQKNGVISAVLTAEGSAGIGFNPDNLSLLKQEGFFMISPCWNEMNPLTGSHITGGGLTERGRDFVRQAQMLGMIIDVSHISDEGFWDVMDVTTAPIIATHSNCRSICNHSRNLTDEMFLAICRTGGVAGINLYTHFLGASNLDAVCDHVFHYLSLDPDGKHIALGGDLDGCESMPEGFSGVQDYPRLAERLFERGLPEKVIYDIFWNNALGVITHCCT